MARCSRRPTCCCVSICCCVWVIDSAIYTSWHARSLFTVDSEKAQLHSFKLLSLGTALDWHMKQFRRLNIMSYLLLCIRLQDHFHLQVLQLFPQYALYSIFHLLKHGVSGPLVTVDEEVFQKQWVSVTTSVPVGLRDCTTAFVIWNHLLSLWV